MNKEVSENIIPELQPDIQQPHEPSFDDATHNNEIEQPETLQLIEETVSLAAFIRHVLPEQGFKCWWTVKGNRPKQDFSPTFEKLEAYLRFCDDNNFETYFSCSSFKTDESRKQENVQNTKAFWLDIDAGKDKNGNDKPYPNADAAYEALKTFFDGVELPFPTIVYSGNGIHAWWVLDREIRPNEWQPAAEALKKLTVYYALEADPARTADIASILRPPQTHHRKDPQNPKLVVCHTLEPPVAADEFIAKLMQGKAAIPSPVQPQRAVDTAPNGKPKAVNENAEPAYAAKVAEHCIQLRKLKDTRGNVSEPEWYASLCVMAHCADGKELSHEWSSGYPEYSHKETEDKLAHALKDSGPTTCERFDYINPVGCKDCQHKGKITSPIQLGKAKLPQPLPTDVETRLKELAALPVFAYELCREEEAKKLNVRVSALDAEVQSKRSKKTDEKDNGDMFRPVESWPEEVNGAELMNEIYGTVRRFIICKEEVARATALWIAFTWYIEHVQVAPIAFITAPEMQCGKTQLLDVIGKLARRPLVTGNISPAAVFRVIETHYPTLVIDEADTFFRENEELRGVINSGHTRQSAFVIRTVGDEHEAKRFSTWGAKAISGIRRLPETIMDRSIVMELRRRLPSETVERLRYAEPGLFDKLASKLARFADDTITAIANARPVLPESLSDRAQDNWEPLLAIADYVGANWPEDARKAAKALSGKDSQQQNHSKGLMLLSDIRNMFVNGVDRLSSSAICSNLKELEDRPWAEFNRNQPITQSQLAKELDPYKIKPHDMRTGGKNLKGYEIDQFKDTFACYLPEPPPVGATAATDPDPLEI